MTISNIDHGWHKSFWIRQRRLPIFSFSTFNAATQWISIEWYCSKTTFTDSTNDSATTVQCHETAS